MSIIFKKPEHFEINYENWNNSGIKVFVLREDLVHPYISGNKWRKLKYNLVDFNNQKKKVLITFGGVYSNHLVATAAASREYNFNSIGIVRGENTENPYLNFMINCGMKLHFISRSEYRNKNDVSFISDLLKDLQQKKWVGNTEEVFILPEGGSNAAAVKGASEIIDEIPDDCDYIACACGTGATIAGISKKLLPHQKAIGISVLKAETYFETEIKRLDGNLNQTILNYHYHFGGYAKKNKTLIDFCNDFFSKTNIPLEPVYTGKLFYGIDDLIRKNYFKTGEKVTVIHTGGIFQFENLKM